MTQTEFLTTLKKALTNQVPDSVVYENVEYYRIYISTECQKGKSEKEVLEELGDPRLIARSIIDANSSASASYRQKDRSSDYGREYEKEHTRKQFHINKWMVIGIIFLILFLIFSIVSFAFRTVFRLLFSFHGIFVWAIVLLVIFLLARRR